MASNINPFTGFIVSCLLVTGGYCLVCYDCNELEVECTNSKNVTCKDDENICTTILFSVITGMKKENNITKIVKGCGNGSPKTQITSEASHGMQISYSRNSCNREKCNEKVIDSSQGFIEDDSNSGHYCYSCISSEKSKCSSEEVKCPADHTNCYEASGTLTIGTASAPLYVKQCADPTNVPTIEINGDWYSISLNATYCTGDLCNQDPTSSTTNPTTVTTYFPTNSTPITPVNTTKTSPTTPDPSGIGRTQPCFVAMVISVVMAFYL